MTFRKFTYLVLSWLLISGCTADKGNYDYISLDCPHITGIPESISMLTHERLRLSPELGGDFPESEWAFSWRALSLSDDRTVTQLSEERNLDIELVLSSGSYLLLFKVTNKDSGVYWQQTYELRVSESTSSGWMILCGEGPQKRVRLDMVSAVTGSTYLDILSGLPAMFGPKKIFWSYYADKGSPFYLVAGQGSTRLGREGFHWNEEYLLEYEMGDGKALSPDLICDAVASKLMIADSKLYYSACLTSIGLFGEAAPGHRFAPAVGTNALTKQIMVPVSLLYDLDSKSLMGYAPGLVSPELGARSQLYEMNELVSLLQDGMENGGNVTGKAFDHFPTGYDFVYMENTLYDPNNTSMGMVYTVLKDEAGYHLYGIQLGELYKPASTIGACGYAIGKSYYGDLSGCTSIDKAEHFAFSSLRGKMYYNVGSQVYGVDLTAGELSAKLELSLPGEEIKCLKFNFYTRFENLKKNYDLVVGSTSGTEGILRIYEGFNSNGDFSAVRPEVYRGLGEIVDVSYRELLD